MGQEQYLHRATLSLRDYFLYRDGWDHDHCEFCFAKFSLEKDTLQRGYVTGDCIHWICEQCFADFRDEMEWSVS